MKNPELLAELHEIGGDFSDEEQSTEKKLIYKEIQDQDKLTDENLNNPELIKYVLFKRITKIYK